MRWLLLSLMTLAAGPEGYPEDFGFYYPAAVRLLGVQDVPGMVCSTSPIQSSDGARVTVTRTASKYCTDASGVLHLIPANTAAIEPNGLLVEGSGANALSQTQALATSPWATAAGVVAAPTLTNNSADVGDPTVLAAHTTTKIVFPAVTGTNAFSVVAQPFTGTAIPWAGSIYLRTASGSATVYLTLNGASYQTATCTVTTTWSRCAAKNKTLTAATWSFQLGVDLRDGGETSKGAQTIYAWGAQAEIDYIDEGGGEHVTDFAPTSYMPGTVTPGTRDQDFVGRPNPIPKNSMSWSTSLTFISGMATPGGDISGQQGENIDGNFADWGVNWFDASGGLWQTFVSDPTGNFCRTAVSGLLTVAANTPIHVYASDDSKLMTLGVNGVAYTSPGALGCNYVGPAYQQPIVYVGMVGPNNGTALNGRMWVRDVCFAARERGCR